MKHDESEERLSTSDARYFSRADQGKEAAQEQAAKDKGKLSIFQRALLMLKVQTTPAPTVAKAEGQEHDEAKTKQKQADEASAQSPDWATKGSQAEAEMLADAEAGGDPSPDTDQLLARKQADVEKQNPLERQPTDE